MYDLQEVVSVALAKKHDEKGATKNIPPVPGIISLTSRGVRVEKDPADLEDTELVDRVCVVDPDPESGYNGDDCDDGDIDEDDTGNNASPPSPPTLFA